MSFFFYTSENACELAPSVHEGKGRRFYQVKYISSPDICKKSSLPILRTGRTKNKVF